MKNKVQRKKYKSSNYIEYFYYFFFLTILITVLLGGALHFYFSSLLRDETIESNNNILAQLKSAQEIILSEVDKSMAQIVMEPILNNYEDFFNRNDYITQKAVFNKLDNTLALNQYIDSIYFYYYKSNLVLSSKVGNTTLDNFYDNEYLKSIINREVSGSFVESRTMSGYRLESDIEVLSLIKPIPIVFNNRPNAIMVVNIKNQYLQQTISLINIKKDSSVFIFNVEGSIISKYRETPLLNGVNILSFLPSDGNADYGHYVKNINGQKTLLSFINSDKYHWKYVYAIPMSTITSRIQFLGAATVLLCLVAIIFGVIGAIFFSKRIYLPIKNALLLFNKSEKLDGNGSVGKDIKETTMLQRNINGLIDRNRSLEEIMKNYEIYDKNKFLQGWVTGNYEIDASKIERLHYYGIDLDIDGYYAAYVISIDNYNEFWNKYSERQQNMLFVYTKENIQNILNDYKGFIVETNRNEIVTIANFPGDTDIDQVKSMAYNLSRQIHALITQNMTYKYTVAVSSIHKGIQEITNCYQEGTSALNYRILLGHNQVILYENVESKTGRSIAYPYSIEKDIINNLKIGNRDEIFNVLNKFSEYIVENLTENIEYVRYYFLQFLSSSIKCAYEIDMNVDDIFEMQKNIYEVLLKEDTMQGMHTCVVKFYEYILKFLDEKRLNKNNELIGAITEYIRNNLGSDLSIESIAANFYISSSYLRKIFKDEAGETIKTYINNQKLEKAMELLRDPDYKISDIAENIGYLSVQAFSKAFKFYIGKTPGGYRTQEVRKSKSMVEKI